MIRVYHPGSGSCFYPPESRIQGSKRHRIPDPQHWRRHVVFSCWAWYFLPIRGWSPTVGQWGCVYFHYPAPEMLIGITLKVPVHRRETFVGSDLEFCIFFLFNMFKYWFGHYPGRYNLFAQTEYTLNWVKLIPSIRWTTISLYSGPKWHSPIGSMPFHRAQKVSIMHRGRILCNLQIPLYSK